MLLSVKKVRHYFRHYFVLFTFNSMLSFLFYYVNLLKGELLVNLCVSTLIDWGQVTRICVGNLTIRQLLVAWSAPCHYLNQCWNIVNWTLKNRFQWNHTFSFKKIWKCPLIARFMGPTWGPSGADMTQVGPMNFAIWVVRKMAAISSWLPCVYILRPSDAYIHRWFMSSFI